jgi:hypothetical protein
MLSPGEQQKHSTTGVGVGMGVSVGVRLDRYPVADVVVRDDDPTRNAMTVTRRIILRSNLVFMIFPPLLHPLGKTKSANSRHKVIPALPLVSDHQLSLAL